LVKESDELDYILQVISNRLRREIIKLIAEKGPISYTKLMKETGIDDSGTFGFHIKKMRKLLKKNDLGEYMLNRMGLKAFELIKELEGGKVKVIREFEENEFEEFIISDKLSFEFNEAIAKKLYMEKKKVIFTDIVNLTIHPMPPELFDVVVKEISDCLTVYVPKDLKDIFYLKSHDVLSVKSYEGEKPKKKSKIFIDLGFIPELLSNVLEGVISSFEINLKPSLISKKRELYLENEIKYWENTYLKIELNGGVLDITEGGRGYLRVWKTGRKDPDIDIEYENTAIKFEMNNGYFELIVPYNKTKKLYINTNGGIIKAKLDNLTENILEISGGYINQEISTNKPLISNIRMDGGVANQYIKIDGYSGETELDNIINGGVYRGILEICEDIKLSVKADKFGGLSKIELNGERVSDHYMDDGFNDATSKLYLNLELNGGVSSIDIRRK